MVNANTKWFRYISVCDLVWHLAVVNRQMCGSEKESFLTIYLRSGDGKIPSCLPYAVTIEGAEDSSSETLVLPLRSLVQGDKH